MMYDEIINGLECLTGELKLCKDCSYSIERFPLCRKICANNAIDLINRQQKEIERLKRENKILSINADNAFQDGLNEAQDLYAEQVKNEVQAEAINEFADKLKRKAYRFHCAIGTEYAVPIRAINDTLNETAGDEE